MPISQRRGLKLPVCLTEKDIYSMPELTAADFRKNITRMLDDMPMPQGITLLRSAMITPAYGLAGRRFTAPT